MSVIEKAVSWAEKIAADDSHGYDQSGRWGPDYDCSSLVITAFKKAGLPLVSTYTGNMRSDFFNNGFAVAQGVNLATGEGLKAGDVLLNEVHHTALYIGNGKIVQASINEKGGITGGQTGDQTGNEIHIRSYYNYPWDCVLRYVRKDEPTPEPTPKPGTKYTVVRGDTLWGIAERFLGSGDKYPAIMRANNLIDTVIHPGQELLIPSDPTTVYHTIQVTITHDTYTLLTIMAEGNDLTIGQVIDMLMEDAV